MKIKVFFLVLFFIFSFFLGNVFWYSEELNKYKDNYNYFIRYDRYFNNKSFLNIKYDWENYIRYNFDENTNSSTKIFASIFTKYILNNINKNLVNKDKIVVNIKIDTSLESWWQTSIDYEKNEWNITLKSNIFFFNNQVWLEKLYYYQKDVFEDIFIHEFGHIIDLLMIKGKNDTYNNIYLDYKWNSVNKIDDFSLIFYNICWVDEFIIKKECYENAMTNEYSKYSVYEDFSETFFFYLRNKGYIEEYKNFLKKKKYNQEYKKILILDYIFKN